MPDITVTSRDIEMVRKAHRKFPKLMQKTFPATVREEIKPFRRDIRSKMRQQNWSRAMLFGKSKNPGDTHKIRTKIIKFRGEVGVRLTPFFQGLAVLQEQGSYITGERRKIGGASTGVLKGKPAYGPAWISYKTQGKSDVQKSFLIATDRVFRRELRKRGLT